MTKKSLSIMEKIMYPLGGLLTGTLIMATGLKLAENIWGILISMIIIGAFSHFLLKKYPGEQDKKLIAWGFIISLILIGTLGLMTWIIANILMAGISG